jgi:hypothetical protein
LAPVDLFATNFCNTDDLFKFKNLKSQDLQILGGERNSRLLNNILNETNSNINFRSQNNYLTSFASNTLSTLPAPYTDIYANSKSN